MADHPLLVPGVVRHSKGARSDADFQKEARAHHDGAPGLRFLADVFIALHAAPESIRTAMGFYRAFPARITMSALESRADLRARVIHALTGGPLSLARRTKHDEVAAQIELLVENDLPEEERAVRAEADRGKPVVELYLKYLDPIDLVVYLPSLDLFAYEREGNWWEKANDGTRRLMAAEIKSVRRHAILSDTEILDIIGDERIERDLPLAVRTVMRKACRQAAAEGRAFKDKDQFECLRDEKGTRDLVDDLVTHVSLAHLRKIVDRAAEVTGLVAAKPQPATPPSSDGGNKSSEPKIETKPEAKVEAKPEPKPEAKAEAKSEPKPEAKAEAKSELKPEEKAEPKAEEAKAEAKAEGKDEGGKVRKPSLMESLAPPSKGNGGRDDALDDDAFS